MPDPVQSLIITILIGLCSAIAAYGVALARERKPLLGVARSIVMAILSLVLILTLTLWSTTGHFPLTTLGEFLVTLSLLLLGLALTFDLWKGRRLLSMGASFAGLLNFAVALFLLSQEGRPEDAGPPPLLHIVTFMVSFIAFEILFISAFTSLLLQRMLKQKKLWIFEMTPSLEASARTSMISLIVGFVAFTIGLLSAYLYARGADLPEGWRVDIIVYLTAFTWLTYLIALIVGLRGAFRSRLFNIASMASFAPLLLTLLASLLWSDFHRFPR